MKTVRVAVPFDVGPNSSNSVGKVNAFRAALRDFDDDFREMGINVTLDLLSLSTTTFVDGFDRVANALKDEETLAILDAMSEWSAFQGARIMYAAFDKPALTVSGEPGHTNLSPRTYSLYPSFEEQDDIVCRTVSELLYAESTVVLTSHTLSPKVLEHLHHRTLLLSYDGTNIFHLMEHVKQLGIKCIVLFANRPSVLFNAVQAMNQLGFSGPEYTLVTFHSMDMFHGRQAEEWAVKGINVIGVTNKIAANGLEALRAKVDRLPPHLQLPGSFDHSPVVRDAIAFDSANALFHAIKQACGRVGAASCNQTHINQALAQVSFAGLSGQIEFDAATRRVLPRLMSVRQMQTDSGLDNRCRLEQVATVYSSKSGNETLFEISRTAPLRFDAAPTQVGGSSDAGDPHMIPAFLQLDACGDDQSKGRSRELRHNKFNSYYAWSECQACPSGSFRRLESPEPLCTTCPEGQERRLIEGRLACTSVQESTSPALIVAICVVLFVFCFGVFALVVRHKDSKRKRKTKDQIRIANNRAEAEADLAAYVFHEVRNPFGVVDGSIRTVLGDLRKASLESSSQGENYDCIGSAVEDLNVALKSSEHIARVLDNVLDAGRLMSGQAKPELAPFDLARLCQEIVNFVPRKPNVKVHIHFDADQFNVLGDEHRMRQVLINLMSNAVKYTPSGSVCLKVTILGTPSQAASSSGLESAGPAAMTNVLFQVQDTGVGIPPDLQKDIFDKFKVVNQSAGTGLGLAISYQIVKLLGSQLELKSPWKADGTNGCCFSFKLLLEKALGDATIVRMPAGLAPSPSDHHQASVAPQLKVLVLRVHVLIADDEPVNLKILSRLLKMALADTGVQLDITHVSNGDQALAQVIQEGKHFDCFIFDQQMRRNSQDHSSSLTGTDTIQELKKYYSRQRIDNLPFFIIASGNCLPAHVLQYLESGAQKVWPKPYPKASIIKDTFLEHIVPIAEESRLRRLSQDSTPCSTPDTATAETFYLHNAPSSFSFAEPTVELQTLSA